MRRGAAASTVGLLVLLCSRSADAQRTDLTGAEAMFEQGRKLMAAGNLEQACPTFAESHRLAPAAGTALNLGVCYEKQNKLASAWGAFREALALSSSSNQQDRAKFARDRVTALEPRLARLVINVPMSELPGLEVRRDGIAISRAQWGTPIPVDTGAHVIEATAPERRPSRTTIDVTSEGKTTTFTLPELALVPKPPPEPVVVRKAEAPPPPPPPPQKSGGGALRVIGIGTAILGVGAIGTGVFFGLRSASRKDDLEAHARSGGAWGPDEATAYDRGKTAATVANVLFIAGAAVVVVGGVMTVLGFRAKRSTATTALAPSKGGLAWDF